MNLRLEFPKVKRIQMKSYFELTNCKVLSKTFEESLGNNRESSIFNENTVGNVAK